MYRDVARLTTSGSGRQHLILPPGLAYQQKGQLSQGGGMDSGQFMIVLQESIQTYRWMGVVLSFLGGFGFIRLLESGSGIRP